MTVEARYVVIRNGEEVETFMDKKAADEHDKMLDIAENVSQMLAESPVEIKEDELENLSIYLSTHRDKLISILQARKPKAPKKEKPADKVAQLKEAS